MRPYILVFAALAVMFTACNDGNKQVDEEFNKLMAQNDSITQVQSDFENIHETMRTEYQELSQKIESAEVKDSTMMGDLAAYEVVLQKHDTWMSSHQETIEAHKELQSDFNNMTTEEKQAQITKMKNDHQGIMSEHETMRSEHDKMKKDFEQMRTKLNESSTEQES